MLSAFLTGFVGGVAKQIEDQSERMEEDTRALIARRAKEKATAEAKAEAKKEEIKEQYKRLKSVLPSITEAQAVGLINEGNADFVIKAALEKKLTAEETARMYKVSGDQEKIRFDDYLAKATTLTRGAPIESEMLPEKGPFGLSLTAGKRALESGIARTGYSKEELEATKLGTAPEVTGAMDVSVFAEQKDKKIISKELRVADFAQKIYDAKQAGDTELAKSLTKQRDVYLESFPKDADKDKALSFANKQVAINTAIKTAAEKNTVKLGSANFNIVNGELMYSGDPEQVELFNKIKVDAARAVGLDLADREGRVDKDTALQLRAFGVEVDSTNRIVMPKVAAPAPAPAAAPKAPAAPAAPKAPPVRVLTKEQYDALPSGAAYIDTDNFVKQKR